MPTEKELTHEESLDLITRMINTTRKDYYETGVSALLWGSVITVASLVTFTSCYFRIWGDLAHYIWFLTFAAVIPQVIISIRESRVRKAKTYDGSYMVAIWTSFAVVMFLLSWYSNTFNPPQEGALFMIVYGIPTFITGFARQFKPMLIGGIACWVFAILSTHCLFPFTMLYLAASALVAWFIPGLILRSRYLKAKQKNV